MDMLTRTATKWWAPPMFTRGKSISVPTTIPIVAWERWRLGLLVELVALESVEPLMAAEVQPSAESLEQLLEVSSPHAMLTTTAWKSSAEWQSPSPRSINRRISRKRLLFPGWKGGSDT